MNNLENKVAIITGSSIGIGRTLAFEMAKRGAKIVLNARNPERLEKAHKGLLDAGFEAIAVAGDVSKMEDCQKLIDSAVKAFGKIDILVNNAGISMEGTVEELAPEVFKKVMDVNYLGTIYPTKAALPYLRKTKGSLMLIGSLAGIRGIPNYSVYSSSKMALTALAESLIIELDGSGIHVGLAYVGFTQNDPEKTIFDKDGKVIEQPKRDFIKAEPPEKVALRIINMIENRRFKQYFTPLGKLNAFMNRFFPFVIEMVLRKNYKSQS
jgi:short-subunit dehydrogenase